MAASCGATLSGTDTFGNPVNLVTVTDGAGNYLFEGLAPGDYDVTISALPAGAVPKDGPSAGVTMVTAIASLLSDTPVKSTIGMTGEVTLQGRVLPIGGVKQKVLAAHRAGLKEVILPKRNEGDLDDVPEQVREEIAFHPVETVDEVLAIALEREDAEAVTAA